MLKNRITLPSPYDIYWVEEYTMPNYSYTELHIQSTISKQIAECERAHATLSTREQEDYLKIIRERKY